jgi:hypothetical protein
MQPKLFAFNSFSLQTIHDTFYAETPLMNFDSFTELHNEYQLAHKDLVPSSLIIAETIQKQRSSIPLKALFDPGLDLMFIHERCIPHGAIPVILLTTTGWYDTSWHILYISLCHLRQDTTPRIPSLLPYRFSQLLSF